MYTPIKLDKMRNLRYRMKALSVIEKHFKMPLAQVDFNNLLIEDIVYIIWAGLVHEDRDLSYDQLLDIIDDNGITLMELYDQIFNAVSEAYGPDETSEGENPLKAAVE